MLTWNTLERPLDLETLVDCSYQTPCIIFKHSTRCSISSVAKMRLERGWKLGDEQVIPYFLDLIAYRSLSDAIANRFGVQHESPRSCSFRTVVASTILLTWALVPVESVKSLGWLPKSRFPKNVL
jgi:bacillithiol system protein YtxJ